MSLSVQAITNTAVNLTKTPFARGTPAVALNQTAGALTLQSSEDGVTYDAGVTVPANGTVGVVCAPFMRLSAAGTVSLLSSF